MDWTVHSRTSNIVICHGAFPYLELQDEENHDRYRRDEAQCKKCVESNLFPIAVVFMFVRMRHFDASYLEPVVFSNPA